MSALVGGLLMVTAAGLAGALVGWAGAPTAVVGFAAAAGAVGAGAETLVAAGALVGAALVVGALVVVPELHALTSRDRASRTVDPICMRDVRIGVSSIIDWVCPASL
jgi:hypothetical protein